ncbi:MAG TPA: hypothetical protein VGB84_07870 [Arachidicoccus sp.]
MTQEFVSFLKEFRPYPTYSTSTIGCVYGVHGRTLLWHYKHFLNDL